jgi:hypothetical protein
MVLKFFIYDEYRKTRGLKITWNKKKREFDQAREKRNQIRLKTLSKKRSDSQSETCDNPSDTQLLVYQTNTSFLFILSIHLSGPEKSQLCHQNPVTFILLPLLPKYFAVSISTSAIYCSTSADIVKVCLQPWLTVPCHCIPTPLSTSVELLWNTSCDIWWRRWRGLGSVPCWCWSFPSLQHERTKLQMKLWLQNMYVIVRYCC